MHDPAGVQLPGGGGDGLPGAQSLAVLRGTQLPAGGQDFGAAAPVDRAVDPAAAEQRGVRGVDDDVDGLPGDVAPDEGDADGGRCAHADIMPVPAHARAVHRAWAGP